MISELSTPDCSDASALSPSARSGRARRHRSTEIQAGKTVGLVTIDRYAEVYIKIDSSKSQSGDATEIRNQSTSKSREAKSKLLCQAVSVAGNAPSGEGWSFWPLREGHLTPAVTRCPLESPCIGIVMMFLIRRLPCSTKDLNHYEVGVPAFQLSGCLEVFTHSGYANAHKLNLTVSTLISIVFWGGVWFYVVADSNLPEWRKQKCPHTFTPALCFPSSHKCQYDWQRNIN